MCPQCFSMNYRSDDGETYDCDSCGCNFTPMEGFAAAQEWERDCKYCYEHPCQCAEIDREIAAMENDYPMGCDTMEERDMDRE